MRKAVIFNYRSMFVKAIENVIKDYNLFSADDSILYDTCKVRGYLSESMAGSVDIIIHSGGRGTPVKEDKLDISKLYICHSHQWKARHEGGEVIQLGKLIKGVMDIDLLEDNEVLGRKGKLPIMQYHELAVTKAPPGARVLATSKAVNSSGKEIEIIEALEYPDGSISVQGHPEEGTAKHIFYNFFKRRIKNGSFS